MYKKLKSGRLGRRGVLLIVVLSLLVLFALIGLTFVVVAGHYSTAARISVLNDQTSEQGPEVVDQVVYDFLRGQNNTNSALFDASGICNSLLEDLYGNDGVVDGTVRQIEPFGSEPNAPYRFITVGGTLDPTFNAYAGQVITMVDGPAAMLSARIVLSMLDIGVADPGSTILFVEPFKHQNATAFPESGNRYIISGRPLNGTEGVQGDESYDAPDVNNPHLAFIPNDAPNTPLVPSFAARLFDFDGDSVTGSLDPGDVVVDNDMDGLNDSGFIDMGYVVKTASDGRRYKPLAAILCIDLDGRLNLNAHGNLAQLAAINPDYSGAHTGPLAGDATPSDKRGLGFGPADVNLRAIFPGNATKYQALLTMRYGADAQPGPGSGGLEDLWRFSSLGIPNDYATSPLGYASRPDVFGGALVGVDHGGRPNVFNAGIVGEIGDSPYQMNLTSRNGRDLPISAAEMERLFRWNDIDRNTLPKVWDRSADLDEADFTSLNLRRSITSSSMHVPVSLGPGSATAMLYERIVAAGVPQFGADGPFGFNFPQNDEVRKMLGYALVSGGKMDVNQHWGNGVDNDSNGVIDDPAELASGESMAAWSPNPYASAPAADYLNTSPDYSTDQALGRYVYARQLYTLMLLVSDADYKRPATETLTDPERRELTVRRIAQWAINCVDFRDPDAIMTPFEYDANPFDGWHVDGDLKTDDLDDPVDGTPHPDRRVVWGMEYPDALLTETLAFHDRRMRDTEWDNHSDTGGETDHPMFVTTGQGPKRIHTNDPGDGTMPGDKDLDQVRIPEGSLFFEMYCTRNKATNNPVLPAELYTSGRLDLGKMVGGYPVWRVAISRSHHNAGAGQARYPVSPVQRRLTHPDTTIFQPNHPDPTTDVVYPAEQMSVLDPAVKLNIERYVWFSTTAPPAASGGREMNDENTFYNRNAVGNAQLLPGNYLVVGPRDTTFIGSKPDGTTPDGPTTVDGDQQITLTGGFAYQDAGSTATAPANIVTPVQSMVAAINATGYAGGARGLNVSEPFPISTAAGTPYPVPAHARESYGDGTDANLYKDEPLDKTGGRPLTELSATVDDTQETKKYENYRTAFLQRVANPLQRWNPPAPHAEHDANLPLNPYITVDWQPIDLTVFNGEDRSTWSNAQVTAYGEFDPDDPNADYENGGTADPLFGSRHRSASSQNLWSPTSVSQSGVGGRASGEDEFCQFNLQHTLGYLNSSYGTPLASPALGDPADGPFPWLMWPNRPFVSHYELMLVPASEQSRLCSELTPALTTLSPYGPTNDPGMFGHLLNFYQTSTTAGEAPHFYRALEFLEVPSRYAGTADWFDPTYSNAFGVLFGLPYRAPFHGLSRFRDPGRVNINTIPGAPVWEAIDSNGASGTTAFTTWAKVDASRRGTLDAYGRFGNAFRGSISGANTTSVTSSDISKSLLRPDPDTLTGATPGPPEKPLFGPPLAPTSYNSSDNAYFRMQSLQRLGNIVSTHSNVYAIWITVGYFEVDAAGAPIRELGADTGEIVRHRGFYIVDRSIPVAFQRGRNYNVDNCILLRRYIE